jgi:hypothetical protein
MTAIIIIGLVFFLIWLFLSGSDSRSTSNTRPTTYKTPETNYKPTIVTKQSDASPKTISVTPTTIKSTPDLKLSLIDGEKRTFQNYYVGGIQYTFGFPKTNCKDKRVWVGIGNKEVERISQEEAMNRINSKSIGYNNAPKQINNSFFDDDDTDDLPF